MTSCSRTFDGSSLADVTYSYDALGRLAGKEGGAGLEETYNYDIHGWTTGIEAGRGTDTLFSESIRYSSPQKPEAVPLYSGNISEIASLQYGSPVNTYSYSYDGTSRLTDARHFIGSSLVVSNTDTERSVSYDANGNIMTLTRYGASYADRSVLGFSYTGNRMTGAVDVVNQHSFSFGYDADGNRTADGRTGLEFSYNILNLPCEVHDGQQNMQMRYTYLSDGTKVSALDAAGKGLLYRGNFVYEKTGNTVNLESVAWDEGRIKNTVFLESHDDELIDVGDTLAAVDPLPDLLWHPGLHATDDPFHPESMEPVDEPVFEHAALFQDQWFVRDHLGNVRSVIDLSGSQNASTASLILEQDDYLPYGTKVVNGSQSSLSPNRYRYAGKEEQRIGSFSSQLLDFGARSYDPWACRWTTVDPLAQKYFGMSPYIYCGNDPVNFFDPDGEDPITGALIGGGASYFGQVGANWITRKVNNLSAKEIFLTKVDFLDVLVSAGEGALTSGASALKKVAIGSVSGAVQGAINISYSSGVEVTGVAETAVGAAIGAVSAAIPESENNQKPFSTTKSESNNKVVAAARQKAAENGESLSPQQYNELRKANNETIKNAQEKNNFFWNSTFDSIKGAAQSLISTLFGHED